MDSKSADVIHPSLVPRYVKARRELDMLLLLARRNARGRPDAPAGPVALALTEEMLASTRRVVAREKTFGRAVPMHVAEGLTCAALVGFLEDADMALRAFHTRYYLDSGDEFAGWLLHDPDKPGG